MSFATRHNKTSQFTNVPQYGEHPIFKSLKELYRENGKDAIYRFHGFYVNKKGKYGNAPAAYLDACIANFPPYLLDEMVEFTDADIDDTNNGRVGFRIEVYQRGGKDCYGVQWVDM